MITARESRRPRYKISNFTTFMSSAMAFTEVSLNTDDLTQKTIKQSGNGNVHINLENWMGQLPPPLARMPLIHLSIPGSHNSFSYSLSPTADVSPDSPEVVQGLGKWLKPIANRIVYNWSKGQKENVLTQLSYGIRYFDIRLVVKDGEIYISHGLYGGPIVPFLQEMSRFLTNHPAEVAILDFQHFYNFTMQNHEFIEKALQQIFGQMICRRRMLMIDISLKYMWQERCQVIIIYRHSKVNYNDLCWPSGSWITAWPNKIKTNDLLEFLDHGLTQRKEGVGFVSQGILTPNSKYVIFHCASSLKKLALKNNKKLCEWLDTKTCGRHGVNVLICDFIESYSFCEKVVRLNYKILENTQHIKY